VREADSGAGQQLESEVGKLYGLVSALGSDRGQIATQAAAAAQIADRLAPRMAAAQFDQAAALRLLKNISGDAGYISGQGERSAEQAAMVLDSLFVAYSMNTKVDNAEQIRTAIHGLFQQLNDPSSYNAPRFAQQMRALNDLIR
jgi:uncharacterized protein (DUF3084 family)